MKAKKSNIYTYKSLSEFEGRYKKYNCFVKLTKSEVDNINKTLNNKNDLLNKSKWCYVEENKTYYKIPRLFSFEWFKNLHVAIKTGICVVGVVGIVSAVIFPIYGKKWFSKDYSSYCVACIGDSITWGHEPGTGLQLAEPYPVALKNALGFGYVSNYGISSSTICNDYETISEKYSPQTRAYAPMVERVRTIAARTNLIIVWGGINDYDRGYTLGEKESTDTKTLYGALNDMCEYFDQYFSNSFVMFITPLPAKYLGDVYYADEISDAITEICNTKYQYPVLNLTHDSGFEEEINAGLNDGVHPAQNWIKNKLVPQIVNFIEQHL